METVTSYVPRCPRCGATIAPDAPESICSACVLAAATETISRGSMDGTPTMTSVDGAAQAPPGDGPRLGEGQVWGSYRIGRLLGRGGMGEVYEAEHIDSQRRVALKVLRTRLHSVEDRARFLREGQLAASVSHPHTVYIFGSEEIGGTPVISMELVPGGTLKDRVAASGPLPIAEAVAAVLDIIGGLDAAAAAGILHRDIKPSNCFVDADGDVKVGDFGLSISTLARDVRHDLATSGFEGTPQFAPPEQLRGEPLDVRADIYAVGATLYYLLTGRPPFDAPDLRELFSRVTTDAPVSPRAIRPAIPADLAAVVLRCLARDAADRPPSYALLAEALRPFTTREDAPARLGFRVLAYVLDGWLIVGMPVTLAASLANDPLNNSPARPEVIAGWTWTSQFVYFLLVEGRWSASLGKRLLGLRVTAADGSAAGWRRILLRTVVFFVPPVVMLAGLLLGPLTGMAADAWRTLAPLALSAALFFSTARRANGWRGLHEVLSGTRVVARAHGSERLSRPAMAAAVPAAGDRTRRFGPFVAHQDGSPGTIVPAFDPVLRRAVWIQPQPADAPAIQPARRDIARSGRLHWLTGHRSAHEGWDAFEAPDGRPMAAAGARAAGWPETKLWLRDLAEELAAAEHDGTLPALALDRVWIRGDGRVVLLDFPAPGAAPAAGGRTVQTPQALLAEVGAFARARLVPTPDAMPLSARQLLDAWAGGAVPPLPEARRTLAAAAAAPDRVPRLRRAAAHAIAASPVVLMLLVSVLIVPALGRFASSEESRMLSLLGALRSPRPGTPMARPDVQAAAEIVVAGRFGERIGREAFWSSGVMRELAPEYRPQAEAIAARHPDVTPEALVEAEATLAANRPSSPGASLVDAGGVIISTLTAAALALVAGLSLISALLVPGGVVTRGLGLAVVGRDGAEVSRGRSAVRMLLAMTPAIAWFLYLFASPRVQGFVPTPESPVGATLLTLAALGAGIAWTLASGARGPHDRLAGTWVIPR